MINPDRLHSRKAIAAGLTAAIGATLLSGCNTPWGKKPETTCYKTEYGIPSPDGDAADDVKQSILNAIAQLQQQRYEQAHPHAKHVPEVNWDIYGGAGDASVDIGRKLRSTSPNSIPQDGTPFWFCLETTTRDGKVTHQEIVAPSDEQIQQNEKLLQQQGN